MTVEAMRRGSGRAIGEWIAVLDEWRATRRPHREIARWLVAEHGIGGWWAQSVTVAYERARGMRAMRPGPGELSITVSRTIAATAERISDAFSDEPLCHRWLGDAPMSPRTAKRGRSARFD